MNKLIKRRNARINKDRKIVKDFMRSLSKQVETTFSEWQKQADFAGGYWIS